MCASANSFPSKPIPYEQCALNYYRSNVMALWPRLSSVRLGPHSP
jgi:hypothetical protein